MESKFIKIIEYIKHPSKMALRLLQMNLIKIDDESYLKLKFRLKMGKKLNLEEPKTFNEKLQWLKLYDRNPEYTKMVDKYEAKKYVAEKIGEEYIIPTLGIYDKFDEINFDELPNQFVIKCTHDSGGLVICRDKDTLDIKQAKKKIEKALKTNFYLKSREWVYKNIKPRIIIEKYMEDTEDKELRDYKFFCFGGCCKCCAIHFNRFIEHHANYYDEKCNILNFGTEDHLPDYSHKLKIPENFEKMKNLAEELSKELPFLRADFYNADGSIYFGELTFYPSGGYHQFVPDEWNEKLGSWIKLPDNEKLGGGKADLYNE